MNTFEESESLVLETSETDQSEVAVLMRSVNIVTRSDSKRQTTVGWPTDDRQVVLGAFLHNDRYKY